MHLILMLLVWLQAVQAMYVRERRGTYTLYGREDDDQRNVFPFPANQSSIFSANTEPSDSPPQDLTVISAKLVGTGQIPRHFIETKCDAGKKLKITNAWAEAKQLADAQTTYKLGYNYDIPHTQWLGKDWNSKSSWIPWKYDYRKLIGDNFERLRGVFGSHAPSGEYVYWYCYDYSRQCTQGVQAYSWDSSGFFWSNHYTVFCPPFYDRHTMADLMVKYNNDQNEQKVMENFHMSRGQIMFHEVWHYKNLVSSPRTGDYAYQAQAVWDLAKEQGTGWAYVNADSYALDAVSIYVQQYYKSSMSPVPIRELPDFDAAAAAAVAEPASENAFARTFDGTPPGWDGPLVTDDKPDLSVWTELNLGSLPAADPAPPPISSLATADNNACHGINGDYWIMSRDIAADNAKDFCTKSDKTKTYNAGSVNELELSVRNLNDGSKGPADDPDCTSRLQNAVIDGCDGADPVNNPHNYKFGSILTTADGWEYKMTPLSKQVNEVNCDVSYKFFYDGFEIRGKNFPDAKLGSDGQGLHNELSSCGAVTKWNFERTPEDCCFQWYASGHLPIGTKSCVGRAVVSAGGSGLGNCHGPGKRSRRDASIDAWPGYGDEGRHVFRNHSRLE
jgi:hypothetical protein